MLKISVNDSNTRRLLILEGKLIAPWAKELENLCQETASESQHRTLIVDVAGVTDISSHGEDALVFLMVRGAKFRGSGVYMKQVLKQLARRADSKREESR